MENTTKNKISPDYIKGIICGYQRVIDLIDSVHSSDSVSYLTLIKDAI